MIQTGLRPSGHQGPLNCAASSEGRHLSLRQLSVRHLGVVTKDRSTAGSECWRNRSFQRGTSSDKHSQGSHVTPQRQHLTSPTRGWGGAYSGLRCTSGSGADHLLPLRGAERRENIVQVLHKPSVCGQGLNPRGQTAEECSAAGALENVHVHARRCRHELPQPLQQMDSQRQVGLVRERERERVSG